MVTKKRKVKPETLSRWDSAQYLRNEANIAAYVDAAIDEAGDDPAYMIHVLCTVVAVS